MNRRFSHVRVLHGLKPMKIKRTFLVAEIQEDVVEHAVEDDVDNEDDVDDDNINVQSKPELDDNVYEDGLEKE